MKNIITQDRLKKEFEETGKAIEHLKICIDNNHPLYKQAQECLDTAKRYYADALHFREKGDLASSFGALNYCHGWIDAGKTLGVFDNV